MKAASVITCDEAIRFDKLENEVLNTSKNQGKSRKQRRNCQAVRRKRRNRQRNRRKKFGSR